MDMVEVSPPKAEVKEIEGGRAVALGGMRRVFKSRQKARGSRGLGMRRKDDVESGSENEDEDSVSAPPAQNTSNHYTLNMSAAPTIPSNMPYILLGCVTSTKIM